MHTWGALACSFPIGEVQDMKNDGLQALKAFLSKK
jgi:hypothetical protein